MIEHLQEELIKRGFVLKPRSDEEVPQTGGNQQGQVYCKTYFVHAGVYEKFKSNGYNASGFEVLQNKTENVRNRLFLSIAEEVYNFYQDKLKQKNQIDFSEALKILLLLKPIMIQLNKTSLETRQLSKLLGKSLPNMGPAQAYW